MTPASHPNLPGTTRRTTRIGVLLGALAVFGLLAWATVALAVPTNQTARARLRGGQNLAQGARPGAGQAGQAGLARQRAGQTAGEGAGQGAGAGAGQGAGTGTGQEAGKQKMQQLAAELGLTPEQRQKIRAIVQPHREEIRDLVDKIKQTHETLKQAAEAQPADDKAIQAAGTELGSLIAQGAKLRASIASQVKSVLTPEQVQKWEQLRASHQKASGHGFLGGAAEGGKAK